MRIPRLNLFTTVLIAVVSTTASATAITEVLNPPPSPGSAIPGTFVITPSEDTWAFGVGNDSIQDTSISGISEIDGLDASDHWISTLIHRSSWESGYDFDSIRPIGATPPSAFSMDTSAVAWQWGSADYVAFYWLSEAGDDSNNPLAVLQAGTSYDAFNFFADNPASPFAAFGASDGGNIITGETVVVGGPAPVPEPSTIVLFGLGTIGLAWRRVRRRG